MPPSSDNDNAYSAAPPSEAIADSDMRLRELGYAPQFKRDMTFLGVIGISFWYKFHLLRIIYIYLSDRSVPLEF